MVNAFKKFENPMKDLVEVCHHKKESYRTAEPFPHCCIDNLISDELLDEVLKEFPTPDEIEWMRLETHQTSHNKLISTDVDKQLGPDTKYLIHCLSSPTFLSFLEELTGIKGLIPDPYLYAGGLHQIESGGYLEIHSDFHWNAKLRLYRRINLILYLNKDWKEDYRGHLELWDEKMQKCVKYLPTWNRIVISNIMAKAYHGFPEPIQCPQDMTRKSLAIWYYTSELPLNAKVEYELYRPDWISRSGKGKFSFRRTLRKILPPIVFDPKTVLVQLIPPALIYQFQRKNR